MMIGAFDAVARGTAPTAGAHAGPQNDPGRMRGAMCRTPDGRLSSAPRLSKDTAMPRQQHQPMPTEPHPHMHALARRLGGAAALMSALLLAGCAVELENRRASEEVARMAEPAGSAYLGWRVFQNKCASCHGPAASGTANGPDLLPRVRDMGSRQFVSVVLKRYDWSQAATQARGDAAALDAVVERIIRRQEFPLNMPAMEGEPSVNAHLTDLYAYLSARAAGTQGPGRPTR